MNVTTPGGTVSGISFTYLSGEAVDGGVGGDTGAVRSGTVQAIPTSGPGSLAFSGADLVSIGLLGIASTPAGLGTLWVRRRIWIGRHA